MQVIITKAILFCPRSVKFLNISFWGGVSLLFATSNAFAVTINLWDIFPKTTQGENGVFLYGYNPSSQTYRQLNNGGDYFFYTPNQNWAIPQIVRSSVDESWMTLHPAGQNGTVYGVEDIVLAYNVSEANTYTVSGDFQQYGGGSVGAYIYRNETLLWSQGLPGGAQASFDLENITLNANDRLFFGVSSAGDDVNDSSGFRATIVAVPEPASILLFGLGGAGLAFRRFRRKNA